MKRRAIATGVMIATLLGCTKAGAPSIPAAAEPSMFDELLLLEP
jgi:hypothetical protein